MIEPLLSDDDFLADVEASGTDARSLRIWWLGQSGYLIGWGGVRVLVDPYLSDSLTLKYAKTEKPHVRISRRVVDPSRLRGVTVVTSSHGHTDHLDAETLAAVKRANGGSVPKFVAPAGVSALVTERWGGEPDVLMDAGDVREVGGVSVHAVAAAHDTVARDVEGRHVYLGYVMRFGPFTVYHSGDTVVYPGMAEQLRQFSPDIAILPINGKVGNMGGVDAARLAMEIGAKLVIPCHYDLFEFNTADPATEFVPECRRIGQRFRVVSLGERFTLHRQGRIE